MKPFLMAIFLGSAMGAETGTEGILPVSVGESVALMKVAAGLEVELVAWEPAVVDPVAIDWGADGKLWVCEMNDYPAGLDGNYEAGGRVKFLEDVDGDGRYEKATLFLEGLPFPTGVTAWGRGVFVCAAPDLIYAEDTNGDGKADKIEKIFSGFATENYQARLNSLALGLDNWIYGANGLLGGVIRGKSMAGEVNIRNRDFRFDPFTSVFEGVSGVTQYGRARDDWGNWFGCNNSELLLHFPYVERYTRRNPAVNFPAANVNLASSSRIFPISKLQERFNDPDNANRVTSGGGLGIYRDTLLGEEFYGNAFTCEPVHNLVHREVIGGNGLKFSSRRAEGEAQSEFLASSDNWFRPAQVRTGPDGGLYVVDMYRFLIEHPRWIPAKRLAQIDVRAGSDKGRIYRVKKSGTALRPIRDLAAMSAGNLASALDSPNGTERDRVHLELLRRRDSSAAPALQRLAYAGSLPQVRLQALCALEGVGGAGEESVIRAMADGDALVRQNAIRISERFLRGSPSSGLVERLLSLVRDESPVVLNQLALSLGEWNDERAWNALANVGWPHRADPDLRWSILASAARHSGPLLGVFHSQQEWIHPLLLTAAASGDQKAMTVAFTAVLSKVEAEPTPELYTALAILRESSIKAGMGLSRLEAPLAKARETARDRKAPDALRVAAIRFAGDDAAMLTELVGGDSPQGVRRAALAGLRKRQEAEVAANLLKDWAKTSPAVRGELVAMMLERTQWSELLKKAIENGVVQASEISAGDRQRLGLKAHAGRGAALEKYSAIKDVAGNADAGAEIFNKNCAVCHALKGTGFAVGPDLAPLSSKDADYFLKNIVDPNAIVEPRFVAYNVELKDERSILGIIKAENAGALTLVMGGGVTETVSRGEIKEIRASSLSLMPEGMEEAIAPGEMAHLIAYLKQGLAGENQGLAGARPSEAAEQVLRNPAAVAQFILDEKQPNDLREQAVKANPQFAADLIVELTREMAAADEYRRIPWIWRVAIASGRRNAPEQVKRILESSLPRENEALRDWQAVVIGGGLINGISQRGVWPRERILEVIGGDEGLRKRSERSLVLAAEMSDNVKVPSGTRYDALRMVGMELWEKGGGQLKRYLADGNGELQMGAVSGLVDVNAAEASKALVEALPRLTKGNRELAVDGLLRDAARAKLLLAEVEAGRLVLEEKRRARAEAVVKGETR